MAQAQAGRAVPSTAAQAAMAQGKNFILPVAFGIPSHCSKFKIAKFKYCWKLLFAVKYNLRKLPDINVRKWMIAARIFFLIRVGLILICDLRFFFMAAQVTNHQTSPDQTAAQTMSGNV